MKNSTNGTNFENQDSKEMQNLKNKNRLLTSKNQQLQDERTDITANLDAFNLAVGFPLICSG